MEALFINPMLQSMGILGEGLDLVLQHSNSHPLMLFIILFGGGWPLFFSFFSGTILTCSSMARTPSMAKRGVTDLYLAHVTSPNLLVFTLVSVSFVLGGRRLISFGTLIGFGASG